MGGIEVPLLLGRFVRFGFLALLAFLAVQIELLFSVLSVFSVVQDFNVAVHSLSLNNRPQPCTRRVSTPASSSDFHTAVATES